MYSADGQMVDDRVQYYREGYGTNYDGQIYEYYPNPTYTNKNIVEIIPQELGRERDRERRSERSRYERDFDRDYRRNRAEYEAESYYRYEDERVSLDAYGDAYSAYSGSNASGAYLHPVSELSSRGYDGGGGGGGSGGGGGGRRRSSSCSSRSSSYGGSNDGSSYRSSSKSSSSHRRRLSRNRDRDKEHDRRDRDRDRDRGRGRDQSRDRSRDRNRSRERGRRDRDRDYDSRDRDYRRSGGDDVASYKEGTPDNTIMLRRLPPNITESDICSDVLSCGLEAKDIRLLRKQDTGVSRGFAFVEFATVGEAKQWMEARQGIMNFEQHRIRMHYSIPKDSDRGSGSSGPYGSSFRFDWNCIKCGAHNFKRRDFCFKCYAPREETVHAKYLEGHEEISPIPRNTLLFRNLDVLTTEESILNSLQGISSLPIKNIRVAKDPLTGVSRGFCYVQLNFIMEAISLHDQLIALDVPFQIDERVVYVSYARQPPNTRRFLATEPGITVANVMPPSDYGAVGSGTYGGGGSSSSSIMANSVTTTIAVTSTSSAAAAASGIAQAAAASATYSQQAEMYGASVSYSQDTPKDAVVAAACKDVSSATAAAALPVDLKAVGVIGPDGDYPRFPVPDVSTYQYDKSSGYYYDASTGLHYDANSQYYYNSQTQQFLYWDGSKQSYLPASAGDDAMAYADGTSDGMGRAGKGKDKDKQDKVKIAKKIAKDMEKWAKTLNQKKENAKQGVVANQAFAPDALARQSASADAGFAVLEKRTTLAERQAAVIQALQKKEQDDRGGKGQGKKGDGGGLVPAYGGGEGSDSDDGGTGEGGGGVLDESKLLDWQKLACLLCKRQFPSKEALVRHQQLSDLHRQNLETLRKSGEAKYRDRAKERREKFGEPENPPAAGNQTAAAKTTKDMFAPRQSTSYEEPTKRGLDSSNVGNKMLKAMGWNEGQGLGKSNQGRTEIVEAQRRVETAGLGVKGSTYGANAEDSYIDTVKKMMQARYNDSE